MQSLFKVTRRNSYNDYGKFKGIYVIGSRFHNNLPPLSPEVWHINNNLTMELMRMIVNHTGNKGPVITNTMIIASETMIAKEYFDIINNDFGHSAPFQPGTFGGLSEVDVSLSQMRIELDNVVNDTLVTTGTFYKQALPLF